MGVHDPKQMHESFAKYFNSQDAEGLLSLYSDDAVLVAAPDAPAAGKAAIKEALSGFLAMKGTMEFVAEAEPVISGDIALTHAKWKLTLEDGQAMEGSTAEVLRKGADGTWLYVVDNPWGTSVLDG
jgi:uncharacterized protein (TIGR02246 family)